jgi:hypothetical protein
MFEFVGTFEHVNIGLTGDVADHSVVFIVVYIAAFVFLVPVPVPVLVPVLVLVLVPVLVLVLYLARKTSAKGFLRLTCMCGTASRARS